MSLFKPRAGRHVLALLLLCLCALSPMTSRALETGVVTGWIYTDITSIQQLGTRQLDDLKSIGTTTIRVEFIYPSDANERTRYLTAYKNIVQWAGERGIRVIGVLTVNSMLNKSVKPVDTFSVQDFDNRFVPIFKEALDWHDATYTNVNGTPYGVEGWEIWNEPDVYDMRRPSTGSFMGEEFALLCVRAYEHYKGHGGTRKIIMGALSRWDDDILFRQVYDSTPVRNFKAAQGRNVLPGDAIGMHAYGNLNVPPSQKGFSYAGGNFEDVILSIRSLRDSAGRELVPSGQPVYVTEVGFGPNRNGSQVYYWRQATHAAELRYVLETLKRYEQQFQRVYWYSWRDEEERNQPDPRGWNWFGLRQVPQANCGGGATKLAYNVFANFNGRAGPAQRAVWQVLPVGDESWPTGWVSPPSCGALQSPDPFLRAFHRVDTARNLMGQPRDWGGGPYVHRWGNGQVQHFMNGVWEGGLGALGLADGRGEAGYVYGRFYDKWMAIGFTHVGGFPVDNGGGADRHRWDSSISRGMVQDFNGGSLGPNMLQLEEWPVAGAQVLIVQGAWYQHYMANGGVGVFGYARTEPYPYGGQYRMDFARGYMIQDPATGVVQHYF
ncbi:cellulase family glycosylhydrolase [Pyxidicoccus parkwayensis]|uniref:Cellulase family glycosylhydrolase n=1 Tax=Pyxidicoccus parkwayensis TaxID=2813578 RepID=A0ABX7NVD6_9BACT|nr:cellulase family glycosylhydrolase [Pyxidicoccus parkwaysis]QSQ22314.1 cellulase family glycosylhydrolase [Pyxidicoccus parkwaysis]